MRIEIQLVLSTIRLLTQPVAAPPAAPADLLDFGDTTPSLPPPDHTSESTNAGKWEALVGGLKVQDEGPFFRSRTNMLTIAAWQTFSSAKRHNH